MDSSTVLSVFHLVSVAYWCVLLCSWVTTETTALLRVIDQIEADHRLEADRINNLQSWHYEFTSIPATSYRQIGSYIIISKNSDIQPNSTQLPPHATSTWMRIAFYRWLRCTPLRSLELQILDEWTLLCLQLHTGTHAYIMQSPAFMLIEQKCSEINWPTRVLYQQQQQQQQLCICRCVRICVCMLHRFSDYRATQSTTGQWNHGGKNAQHNIHTHTHTCRAFEMPPPCFEYAGACIRLHSEWASIRPIWPFN